MTATTRSAAQDTPLVPEPGWENPLGTDGFEFVEYTAPTRSRSDNCSR